MIKFVNYRLHKFFDLAVRCDDTIVENQKLSIDINKDLEEQPKLLNHRTTMDIPSGETQ
jgi:hypothetical protein